MLLEIGNSCLQMLGRPLLQASDGARAQLVLSARQTTDRLRVGPLRLEKHAVDDFTRGFRILDKQAGARP